MEGKSLLAHMQRHRADQRSGWKANFPEPILVALGASVNNWISESDLLLNLSFWLIK